MEAEIEALEGIDLATECLDLPRLRRLVESWPEPLTEGHAPEYAFRLLRGMMMGRFIRWFEEEWAA